MVLARPVNSWSLVDILFVIVSNFSVKLWRLRRYEIKFVTRFSSVATMQMKGSLMSWFLSTIALIQQAITILMVGFIRVFSQRAGEGGHSIAASPTTRPFTVLVEGNIGSGKSSFLNIMESWPGVTVLQVS